MVDHAHTDAHVTAATAPRLLLTIEEAAERLGVGRSTMYGLIKDGEVESVQIGRLRRVPADALPEFLVRLRSTAPSTGRKSA